MFEIFIGAGVGKVVEVAINELERYIKTNKGRGKVDKKKIEKLLENYFIGLASRVSTISSICFPQHSLNINDAYEPLFIKKDSFNSLIDFDFFDKINELDGSYLLLDSAGMGKSTFSKFLITKFLYKCERFPIFLELRKINPNDDLLDCLAKEFDPLGDSFPRDFFNDLIKNGKFLIVLDGFDEVQLEWQENLASQINQLSLMGSNVIFLTSREQALLPRMLNCTKLRFSKFTREQATSLVYKLDKISKCSIGKRLILEFDSVPLSFLENPLLVSLLYTTFGLNNSIAESSSTFYSELYEALYKGHDLKNKNGFIREKKSNLNFEDFRTLLRVLCFIMIAKRKISFSSSQEAESYIDLASSRFPSKFETLSTSDFLDDLLNSVPLMQKDGSEYKFLHKTIIEFFCSEFIVVNRDRDKLILSMLKGSDVKYFNNVFNFIYEIVPDIYHNIVTDFYASQVLSECDFSNNNKLIVSMVNRFSHLWLGVFPVDSFSHDQRLNEPHPKIFDQLSVANYFHYNCYVSNDKKYYIVFGGEPKSDISIPHHFALSELAEPFNDLEILSGVKNQINQINQIIEHSSIGKWVQLPETSLTELVSNSLFIRACTQFINGSDLSHELFIFSKEKIEVFIQRQHQQREIENDFADFL